MTDVSTRSQVEATRRPKAAKTETRAAAPGPFWHAPTVQAHSALSTLLDAARTQEYSDADDSADAIRLVHIAAEAVLTRHWIDEALNPDDRQTRIARYASDVQALITGALNFPDQPLVFERRAPLGHASAICKALTDLHCAGSAGEVLVPKLLETIKLQQQPSVVVPPPSRSGYQPASTITAETHMIEGGEPARMLALQCSWDVESVADAIINMADDMSISEGPAPGLARCFGTRVKALNSVLMSYLGDDHITLQDAQYSVYHGAQRLPEGAL